MYVQKLLDCIMSVVVLMSAYLCCMYMVSVCVCVYVYVHWFISCVYLCVHMYMPYAVMIGCCVLTVNVRVRRSKEEDTASE